MLTGVSDLVKINLSQAPAEIAGQLVHLRGLAFIDSSGNFPNQYHSPISIIAAEPDKVIKGQVEDLSAIAKELESPSLKNKSGGAIGWIEYDGNFCFGLYYSVLLYDHSNKQWWSNGDLQNKLQNNTPEKAHIEHFTSNLSKEDYLNKVLQIKEYIAAGDIYQVNLTQKFETSITGGNLYPLYRSLRQSSPAPMASYLNLAEREVLSSSPETFLRITGDIIETRPIKGTRPRFHDPVKDRQSISSLTSSEKEKAELIMITDLLRNDLGKVCQFGSVKVPELAELETLEHVYHLVSRVTGKLKPNISQLKALASCSPGGSITGAPKIRAMEIINELETVPRGLYTGSIGYLAFNGESQFNIAIRTLVREQTKLHYHVGAGIVADSDPEAEYEETLQKAKGIRTAVKNYFKKG